MSRNTMVVLLVAILVVGGLIIYTSKTATPTDQNATSTGAVPDKPVVVNPKPAEPRAAAAPVVTTEAKVAASENAVVLSGKVTPNGAFTTYWYEYGVNANLGSKTVSQSLGSGYVAITAPVYITGLLGNSTYFFRLVGENAFGKVSGGQYSFKTSAGNPPPVGSAANAKTLAATGISRNTVNLNGELTPNKAETQYWFEYGKSANLGNTSAFQSAGSGDAKLPVSVSVSNLDAATTYYFRLNAQNQFGTVNGSILNFQTLANPTVEAPVVKTKAAASIGNTGATLRGNVVPGGAETSYWFEYSSDVLLGSVLIDSTDSTSAGSGTNGLDVETSISGLIRNTTYYFRLVARNSQGTVLGDKLSFKTK